MATFLVKTRSTFENIYLIEAENKAAAEMTIQHDSVNDFLQKHLGEKVVELHLVDGMTKDYWYNLGRENEYF